MDAKMLKHERCQFARSRKRRLCYANHDGQRAPNYQIEVEAAIRQGVRPQIATSYYAWKNKNAQRHGNAN